MAPVAQVGITAPDFALPDLEGNTHRLSEQQGKIVVLNFWSANCPWSLVADQTLAGLGVLKGEDVRFWPIAANAGETLEQIRAVAAERDLPLVLRDADQSVVDKYEAITTPHVFVIDVEGVLRYKGAINDTTFRRRTASKNYLQDALGALLAGHRPGVVETPAYGCAIVRQVAE